ncbi:MAG: tetratricopeptide repeat protein [Acidobacteria bacterium]|nr:tetratricopeptide repeat protein [Acidobacteriota bacterium]
MLYSPVTLKVCNLAATLATIWLFHFVLSGVPEIREKREIERAAAVRASVARAAKTYEASKAAIADQDWNRATVLTRQLLAVDPENYIYLKQMTLALHNRGAWAEEAAMWERYMLVAPTPAHGCPMIAEAWQKAGNSERALKAYERCYQLAPQDTDTIFYLAHAYERARRPREAKALYQKGLEISPGYSDMAVGLGRSYLAEEKPDRAEELVRGVLEENPDNADALLVLGMALRDQAKLGDARVAFERGIAVAPRYSDFHYMMGRVAEDEGNRDDALRWYREALAISPDRGDAKTRIAKLEGGA